MTNASGSSSSCGDASQSNALPHLNLLVLRAAELRATAAFYEALGFAFTTERHGQGPEHLASVATSESQLVLELYPASCSVDTQAVRLGFTVPNLATAIEQLTAAGGTIVTAPRTAPRGRKAVVSDPDGRRVELLESIAKPA